MLNWLMFATLLVDPRAGRGEVSGGVVVELRGGIAPRQAGLDEVPSFLMVVVPNVDFRFRHRRGGVLTFGYSPRMLVRQPNQLLLRRPLFLHQGTLSYAVALNRRWDMFAGTNASVGDIDYTAQNLVLPNQQTQVANTAVLQFAIGDAGMNFVGRVAPRHTIGISPSVGYRRALNRSSQPIDSADDTVLPATLPDQTGGNIGLSYAYRATRRDQLGFLTYNGIVAFNPGGSFVTDDVRVAWTRQVDTRVTSEIDAGVYSAQVIEEDPNPAINSRGRVIPVGSARIGGRLRSRSAYTLDGTIGASSIGFFDAVRGRLSPRAGGSITLTATMPPRWSAGLITSYFTSVDPPLPLVPDLNDRDPPARMIPQTESALLNQIPIRYRINDDMSIEFGVIANFRMPHIALATVAGTQIEAWGYFAFRIAGGTARGGREVASRGVGTGQGAATGQGGAGTRR